MRIALLATRYYPDYTGGAETRFRNMAATAVRQGHEVQVLATNYFTGAEEAEYTVEGVRVRRASWPRDCSPESWQGIEIAAGLVGSLPRPDVVWAGNAAMALGALRAHRDVPVVFSPGHLLPVGVLARLGRLPGHCRRYGGAVGLSVWNTERLTDRAVKRVWRTTVGSRLERDYVLGRTFGRWPSLQVARRGVVFDDWEPVRGARRFSPKGELHVLVAGRLVECKNFEQVLEAISLCENRAIRLTVCGEGPDEIRLREQAHRLGIEDRVRFIGFAADMRPVYAEADVFVMSSTFDCFPNTVLEALACGVPVVMRRPDPPRVFIGAYELAAQSHGCREYETYSAEDLARMLMELADDREQREAMSAGAIVTARQCDWPNLLADYLPNC